MFVFSLTGQFGARICFNVDQALCWWSKVWLGYSCSIRLSFTFPWPLVVEHSDPAEECQSLRCDFSSTGLSSSGLPLRWTLSPLPLHSSNTDIRPDSGTSWPAGKPACHKPSRLPLLGTSTWAASPCQPGPHAPFTGQLAHQVLRF